MAQSRTRRKKKVPPLGLLIGLCSFLVLLIIVAVFLVLQTSKKKEDNNKQTYILGKDNTTKPVKPEVPKKDDSSKELEIIVNNIRLELFNSNISKSNIKEIERVLNDGTRAFDIRVESDNRKLLSKVAMLLQNNNYNTEIDNNNLFAKKGKNQVVLALITPSKPKDEVTIPEELTTDKKHARLAILLDDGGNNLELAKEFLKLKAPLTIAVIPFLKESKATAKLIYNSDKSLFLHFPMEPKNRNQNDPGKGAVFIETPEIIVNSIVKENFESLGVPVDGFNNHMGSALTEDSRKMKQILSISKHYTNIFVDSRTTPKTVAYKECQKIDGLKCGMNKVFIDNVNDKNAIVAQIYEAVKKARRDGELIAIGHIRPNTLKALKEALPKLRDLNAEVVPLATLAK